MLWTPIALSPRHIAKVPSFFLFALGLLLFSPEGRGHAPRRQEECFRGSGKVVRTIRTVKLRITPGVDKDALNAPICHLELKDRNGNVLLSEDDTSFEVLLDNQDVTGDGIPDLVLRAFSGGAHCCWT